MNDQIKKTAFETSAGTDEKQPLINSNYIIPEIYYICNLIFFSFFGRILAEDSPTVWGEMSAKSRQRGTCPVGPQSIF